MFDLEYIVKNKSKYLEILRLRGIKLDLDFILDLNDKRIKLQKEYEEIQRRRNEIAEIMKGGIKDKEKYIAEGKNLKDKSLKVQDKLGEITPELKDKLYALPNFIEDDVPHGKDESDNVVVKNIGKIRSFDFKPLNHWEIGERLNLIDSIRAARVSGSRFVYLKGNLVILQFALLNFMISILTNEDKLQEIIAGANIDVSSKPFIPVLPPVFVKSEVMYEMGRLEPKDERYYIPTDDLYLVGSAEHSLGSMHKDEILELADLPLRYVGYSTSFRREAGSYGKDMKGILRLHHFDKLEMEIFSDAISARSEQDLLIAIEEYLVKSLNLPYRVISICSGDIGVPDARQFDIEVYFPGEEKYRETHTSDYMSDYQSRRLKIRYRDDNGNLSYVHMNDATSFAAGRLIAAIMENYQTRDGRVEVPEVLRPYMYGISLI